MCLSCSGVHRGLGVHISFIRSITMDAFKGAELARMDAGGNQPFREFWESHESNIIEGKTWDDSTIRERYESEVGEEWKARLSAKIEGREYIPGEEKKAAPVRKTAEQSGNLNGSRSSTPVGGIGSRGMAGGAGLMKSSSISSRSASPALGTMSMGRKAQNEAFFAKKGAENASRPDDLPPSEGGKFAGFGSDWQPPTRQQSAGIPGAEEFQRDPLAALTKGFGWFGGMVQKGVGEVSQKV